MNSPTMNVVVGEGQPVMLHAISTILQSVPGVYIAGKVGCIVELERYLGQVEPDLLVVNIFIGNRCLFRLLSSYLQAHSRVRTLVVTAYDADLYVHFSRKMGARGFISKRRTAEEIKMAFWQVACGKEWWPECKPLLSIDNLRSHDELVSSLTPREKDVFHRIGEWKSTEEIAEELGISAKTIGLHRIHIKDKLHFSSSKDLLHYAVDWLEMKRTGLVDS